MTNKTALTIIVSVILTVIIISIVNVGTSLFLERPEWEDYCSEIKPISLAKDQDMSQELCEGNGGKWTAQEVRCVTTPCAQGYCDYHADCNENYENAQKPYNQTRYYIFAGIGFILLLVGLFTKENMIQLTGLGTGGILVTQGIVMNFENKTIVFVSLIAILLIFGVIAYRIINKKD
jgi:hypothetical protein